MAKRKTVNSSAYKIVLGEGTEDERIVYLPPPKGKRARQMIPKLVEFMKSVRKSAQDLHNLTEDDDVGFDIISELLNGFWGEPAFEDVMVPYVLGLDDPEGREWLEENGTTGDIINNFPRAAEYLIEASFGKPGVEDALGK